MANLSLGIVEVIGLTTAVTAADAMVKAADVRLIGYEISNGLGLVTVRVQGGVAAVQAAVAAGAGAAAQVGTVFAKLVIARPDPGLTIFQAQGRMKTLAPVQDQAAGQSQLLPTAVQPDPKIKENSAPEQAADVVIPVKATTVLPVMVEQEAAAVNPPSPEVLPDPAEPPAAAEQPAAAVEQADNADNADDAAPVSVPGPPRTKKKGEPKSST